MSTTTNPPVTARKRDTQQITTATDSREILANAKRDIERYNLDDYFIVDADSHHVEFDSWHEVLDHIEDPVLRRNGKVMAELWPNAKNIALSNHPAGLTFQDVAGMMSGMSKDDYAKMMLAGGRPPAGNLYKTKKGDG